MPLKNQSSPAGKRRSKVQNLPVEVSVPARTVLLQAAKELFAQRGLFGTSIRDIAKRAKMNSSLISYYFDSKENLYRECLAEIAQARLALAQQFLEAPNTREEFKWRLKLFAENFINLFLRDRDAGFLFIREYDHSPSEEGFGAILSETLRQIASFFQQAQKSHLLPGHKDALIQAHLFFGALTAEVRLDPFKEKAYGRTLKNLHEKRKVLDHLTEIFAR